MVTVNRHAGAGNTGIYAFGSGDVTLQELVSELQFLTLLLTWVMIQKEQDLQT